MGLYVINIGKIRVGGGRVVTFERGVWGTSSLEKVDPNPTTSQGHLPNPMLGLR